MLAIDSGICSFVNFAYIPTVSLMLLHLMYFNKMYLLAYYIVFYVCKVIVWQKSFFFSWFSIKLVDDSVRYSFYGQTKYYFNSYDICFIRNSTSTINCRFVNGPKMYKIHVFCCDEQQTNNSNTWMNRE